MHYLLSIVSLLVGLLFLGTPCYAQFSNATFYGLRLKQVSVKDKEPVHPGIRIPYTQITKSRSLVLGDEWSINSDLNYRRNTWSYNLTHESCVLNAYSANIPLYLSRELANKWAVEGGAYLGAFAHRLTGSLDNMNGLHPRSGFQLRMDSGLLFGLSCNLSESADLKLRYSQGFQEVVPVNTSATLPNQSFLLGLLIDM